MYKYPTVIINVTLFVFKNSNIAQTNIQELETLSLLIALKNSVFSENTTF